MSRFDRMNYGPAPVDQEDLQTVFRTAELQRREVRRKIMMNAAALKDEPLTPEQIEMDKRIKHQLTQMSLEYEKQTRPGYWARLWAALRGK